MRRVNAVVLNWSQPEATLRAVSELQASAGVDVRVLVVDNASPGGDATMLRTRLGNGAVLALADNRGYAGGMNAGIAHWREHGDGEPILVVTPDAHVGPDVAAGLLGELERDARVGAVGPVIVYRGGRRPWTAAGGVVDPAHARVRLLPQPKSVEPHDVDWLEGCCFMVRAEAAADVGGFDERYFLYWEEIDLCARLRARSWRVRLAPGVTVRHPKGLGGQPGHFHYYMTRNSFLFWRKNYGVGFGPPFLALVRATLRHLAVTTWVALVPWRWSEFSTRLNDLRQHARGAWHGTRDHLRGRYGARAARTPPA